MDIIFSHADFAYDGDGTRTATLTTPYDASGQPQTATLTSYYFGGAYEVTGTDVKKYYSFGGQTIMRDANGLQYFLADHLGSIVAVTNATGTLITQQRYLPFGGERTNIGAITQTDFGYTGQRKLDSAMGGLMDYKARFYSPMLGRFLQPDTITPGGPQGLNRYAYVLNNPINANDPSGHKCVGELEECKDNGKPINGANKKPVVYKPKGKGGGGDDEDLKKEFEDFSPVEKMGENDEMIPIDFIIADADITPAERSLLLDENGNIDYTLMFEMWVVEQEAIKEAEGIYGTPKDNAPYNAFLHSFWSALMTARFGEDFAEQYGNAHETPRGNPKGNEFMDLHNNKVGRNIASKILSDYRYYFAIDPDAIDTVLSVAVVDALENGELYIWDGYNIYHSNECPECISP